MSVEALIALDKAILAMKDKEIARKQETIDKLTLGIGLAIGWSKVRGDQEVYKALHESLIDAYGLEQAEKIERISEAGATLLQERLTDA